ncbi:hypothetical protein [Micromonospora sp. NBC_01796]|uniref:hypothetical protein n=1 Tax=Micromonospora sp. NBC_01796 TaxID=2975987 RepID=UPI002DDA081A|nr:hypothetical protein [Micromonospora sp. NBC_01796]WSA88351.1 hypothetical protein OIE47_12490 [Micromonospora sp. NBC_01796]
MRRNLAMRVLLPLAAVLTAILASANPAAAAGNDDYTVYTGDSRLGGAVDFVDYGPGAPGGGNNDDYLVIRDLRGDGHGVQVWAWLHGKYLGTRYNGGGAGSQLIYDPYSIFPNNVAANEVIGLKICLVDGENNLIQSSCSNLEWPSIDG